MRKIDKYNSEGCPDPTAYEALARIESEVKATSPYRPLVYICSPFAGDVEKNIANAKRYCKFAVESGAIPFAPHLLYTQILDDNIDAERKLGLFFGLVWLGKCQEMWVFGERLSRGMAMEIAKAQRCKRLIIRYFTEDCEEVTNVTKPRTPRPD